MSIARAEENIFSDFDDYPDAAFKRGYGIAFTLDDIDPVAMLNYVRNADEDAYNFLQSGECVEFSEVAMKDLTAHDVESALEWYGVHFNELVCNQLNAEYGNVFTDEENMESTVWFVLFEAKFSWEYEYENIPCFPNGALDVKRLITEHFRNNNLFAENADTDDMFGYYNVIRMNCL